MVPPSSDPQAASLSARRPVRVAVVGAGPAGFFTAEALLKHDNIPFEVHVFERLPTPFGLVRSGVAPDHQKIKSVTRTFERTAADGRFRFLGNVQVGRDLTHAELRARYELVVYAVGSSGDRRLGIPGEELTDCHAATAFVGWYNAHPDFKDFPFDFGARRAVVVGVGNVAMDVARVLLRSPEELAKTDIAAHAIRALRQSQVREVVVLARRGPAQVAFTPSELTDIAALEGVRVELDPALLEAEGANLGALDPQARRAVETMLAVARAPKREAARTLRLQFLASPVEVLGDARQKVTGLRYEENTLLPGGKVQGTGRFAGLETGLVFRSIGYLGEPVPGVPYDPRAGVIPNVDGRVTLEPGGAILPGVYAVGWIRRGPTGVIGTNKADAVAVAQRMVEDLSALPGLEAPAESVDALLERRNVPVVSYDDWRTLDSAELAAGKRQGKVREKFASVGEMMNALLRQAGPPDA